MQIQFWGDLAQRGEIQMLLDSIISKAALTTAEKLPFPFHLLVDDLLGFLTLYWLHILIGLYFV